MYTNVTYMVLGILCGPIHQFVVHQNKVKFVLWIFIELEERAYRK